MVPEHTNQQVTDEKLRSACASTCQGRQKLQRSTSTRCCAAARLPWVMPAHNFAVWAHSAESVTAAAHANSYHHALATRRPTQQPALECRYLRCSRHRAACITSITLAQSNRINSISLTSTLIHSHRGTDTRRVTRYCSRASPSISCKGASGRYMVVASSWCRRRARRKLRRFEIQPYTKN